LHIYDWSHAAEAHDIGKLFIKGPKHNLEDMRDKLKECGVKEEWPIVQAILKHHCKLEPKPGDIQLYPDSYETFLICLADSLASQASRIRKVLDRIRKVPDLGTEYGVYKLWKGYYNYNYVLPLDKLTDYLKEDPEGREFLSEFKSYLLRRAEEARKGANITSLYSHSVLSGKFFRLLYKYYYHKISEKEIDFTKREVVCNQIDEILNELEIALIHLHIVPTQYIYRTKDLNAFEIIKDILSRFESKYGDHVLYRGLDDILLIDIPGADIHKNIIQEAHRYGFYIDIDAVYTTFQRGHNRVLGIEPRRIAKRFSIRTECEKEAPKKDCREDAHYYPSLLLQINSPICDICQLRPAKKTWVDEESGLEENLCEECYSIRTYPSSRRLYKLAGWSEGSVAWIRIILDVETLENTLVKLYIKYLSNLGVKDASKIAEEIEKEEGLVSPTLLQEFMWDYDKFIKAIGEKISNLFVEENIEKIDDSFYVIKVEDLRSIVSLIESYNSLLREHFPNLATLEDAEPIRFGISVSHVKFPFHEHWRILSGMRRGFLLNVYRKGGIEVTYGELNATLQFYFSRAVIERKQALYRAVEMAEYSRLLANVELLKHLRHVPKNVNLQLLRMLLELGR